MKTKFLGVIVGGFLFMFCACNNENRGGIHHDTVPDRSDYPGTDRSNTDTIHDSDNRMDTVKTGFGK